MLIIFSVFAIKTSFLQSYIAKKVTSYYSEQLSSQFKIEKVNIQFFNNVLLRGVYVEDLKGDTLLYTNEIKLKIQEIKLIKQQLKIENLAIKQGRINLVKYRGDSTLNFQYLIDFFKTEKKDTTSPSLQLNANQLSLTDVQFSYNNHNEKIKPTGIDFNHINLQNLTAVLSKININQDTITANIEKLGFYDHSGFDLRNLSGLASISPIETKVENLKINTPLSQIHTTNILFKHKGYNDYSDFVKKVKMEFCFQKSMLNTSDLAYFVNDLEGLNESVIFRGNVKGRVRKLKVKDFYLKALEGTLLKGDANINGLPHLKETFITISIDELNTNQNDLKHIPLPPFDDNHFLELPEKFNNLRDINANGSFTGFMNDFVAYGVVKSDMGYVRADVHFTEIDNGNDYRYTGEIITKDFDLGAFYDIPKVQKITAQLQIDAKGVAIEKLNADITGHIKSLTLNGYDYKEFDLQGNFEKNKFKGNFQLYDENISLKYDGVIDLAREVPKINFKAQIDKAYLNELNFIENDISTSFCSKIVVNVSGRDLDELEGYVSISDVSLYTKGDDYSLDDIMVSAINIYGEKEIVIHSDLFQSRIKGVFDFVTLPQNLIAIVSKVTPSLFEKKEMTKPEKKQKFEFDLTVRDIKNIKRLFLSDLELEKGTRVHGEYDSNKEKIDAYLYSPHIGYKDQSIDSLFLDFKQKDEKIRIEATSNDFVITDGWTVNRSDFIFNIQNDSIDTKFIWENDKFNTHVDINSTTHIQSDNQFIVDLKPSYIRLDTISWVFNDKAQIIVDSSEIKIANLEARNGHQFVGTTGKVSKDKTEQLKIKMENFQLNNLAPVLKGIDTDFKGIVNSNVSISDVHNLPLVIANSSVKNLTINDEYVGDLTLISELEDKSTLKMKGVLANDQFESMHFDGFYFLEKEKENIDLSLQLKKRSLKVFNTFLPEQVSGLDGVANGLIKVKGTPEAPELSGNIKIKNGEINIDLLNVKYQFECVASISEDMIALDYFPLRDPNGKEAFGNGTFFHNNFSNWNYDFSIFELDNMLVMNTTEKMNPLYYGTAFVSGSVGVSGYEKNMEINVDVKSEKNTNIHLPLYNSEDVIIQDFITFIDRDSAHVKKSDTVNLEGITMDFQMEVTPDAKIELIFDPIVGDIMQGTGHGDINLVIDPFGNFNMYGQYIVEEADYLFTLQNVINKHFTVEKGGVINWYGDPYDAEVDLNAIYRVKTPLYDLMGEKAESYRDKVDVECKMKLQNELFNPEISFDVEVPKADEDVNSVLNSIRNAEQELNKQVFALMVINKFVPPAGSKLSFTDHGKIGIGATTTAELLNNQLSNWLSQINDDFDIGVNYRPGDQISNEELAVAISTQLFNERLVLSGNFGVSNGNQTNKNPSNLIGDFNIEYKINEDGTFRIRAFNESNDLDPINATQAPYTQGVGVYYKESFNTLKETKILKSLEKIFRRKETEKIEKD